MWGGDDGWVENASPAVMQKVGRLEDELKIVKGKLQQKVCPLLPCPDSVRDWNPSVWVASD
jgi:hypothetical protein